MKGNEKKRKERIWSDGDSLVWIVKMRIDDLEERSLHHFVNI